MEKEFQVLNQISNERNSSQRDIARGAGLSLGNVNLLIQRLVKKGLVKIERVNARTIRYILTPSGLKEKAHSTYQYILNSYRFINKIESKMDRLIHSNIVNGDRIICLLGERDAIFHMVITKLEKSNVPYQFHHDMTEEGDLVQNKVIIEQSNLFSKEARANGVFIVWHPHFSEELFKRNIAHLNLLDDDLEVL